MAPKKKVKDIDKLHIEPLYDRVVCRRLDPVVETEGGMVIPEMAQEKPLEGRVISVGPGRVSPSGEFIPLQVKPGDTILFGKYAGIEITAADGAIIIMREDEILGIIRSGGLDPGGKRGFGVGKVPKSPV